MPIWQGTFEDKDAALIVKDFLKSQKSGEGAHFPLGPGSHMVIGHRIAGMATLVSLQMQEPVGEKGPSAADLLDLVKVGEEKIIELTEKNNELARIINLQGVAMSELEGDLAYTTERNGSVGDTGD